ncbi:MAG: YceI family protein [Planctomycetes bacterium]|nr:YceI family protein [Planctomycetota bacterium]MCB9885685.1 YceI family protein [Planctomycetota bacterium]
MKSLLLLPATVIALAYAHEVAGAAPAAAGRTFGEHDWAIDPVHSSVVFRVKHANASWFQGTFDKIEGTITLDAAKPEDGAVHLLIPVESVDTNDAKRDGHLKGSDFFSAKENPNIEFTSTKITKGGDDGYMVAGKLAMAGKEQAVTIPVVKTGAGDFFGPREGWMATFKIKRSEFGMTYGLAKDALGDEIELSIALETVKPK